MISVVIPTLNSGPHLRSELEAIRGQRVDEDVEVVVIDSGSEDGTPELAESLGARVERIAAAEFGHGRTRNLGAGLAKGETIVFTVDDALPLGDEWLKHLIAPLRDPNGPAATYSRQVPRASAPPHQRLYFDYRFGPEPRLQSAAEPRELTVRTTQFSHVASATSARLLREHPLADDIIVGEDGEWCARILLAGHAVAYVPESVVEHSHDYSPTRTFRRYFDLGVSADRTFLATGRSTVAAVRGEGLAFVRAELRALWRGGERREIPRALAHELSRWAGFRAGVRHRLLPGRLRHRLSATPSYWSSAI